jgi:phosphoribosylanthranilate isomerase
MSRSAPRVKICGVTTREDAELAIALGADALGFNLFSGSKRYIDLEREAEWIVDLPAFVTRVAVVVNLPLEEAQRLATHPAFHLVQLHGDEDGSYCAAFAKSGRPFIKALRVRDVADIAAAADFSTRHVLVDAHVPGAFGGTGSTIDLALAEELSRRQPHLDLILAGGLTPANVSAAVRQVRPFAVDVASGVEAQPGRKDEAKMRAFIEQARS